MMGENGKVVARVVRKRSELHAFEVTIIDQDNMDDNGENHHDNGAPSQKGAMPHVLILAVVVLAEALHDTQPVTTLHGTL
jgi:hypothetical protein